jgi:hypothetical protein
LWGGDKGLQALQQVVTPIAKKRLRKEDLAINATVLTQSNVDLTYVCDEL